LSLTILIIVFASCVMGAEEAKAGAASGSPKVDEALKAKKAAVHALAQTLHKAVKKEAASSSVHQDDTHAATKGSEADAKHAEDSKKAAEAAVEKAHRAHEAHQAKVVQHQALAAASTEVKKGKQEEGKQEEGKQEEKKEVDPRDKQRGKFGWLFKAAEKDGDVTNKKSAHAKQMKLQGGENATAEEGGEGGGEEDEKAKAEDSLEAQKKKNKEEAAKALSFSEKTEVTFVVSLLVIIVILTLLGLCCINYARFFLTGTMQEPQRPQRPGQGPPPGMGGPPPGQGPGYERMN